MKQQSTSWATVTILFLAALALFLGWIYLAYKSYGFKEEISGIQTEAQNKSFQNTYLLSVRTALRDAKDDLSEIDSRFIDKDKVPEFIDLLEKQADSSGIEADFGSINIDPGADNDLRRQLHIRVSGTGTWMEVTEFVADIDSLPFAAKIDNIGFNRQAFDAEKGEAVWLMNLDLSVNIE